MSSDRRKRMWKRMRFWGGMFLVVVVGIGLLCWHSYRKSLGPPPTPPGKSPEFEQHLAEIDKKWLFLFEDNGKIILSDVYGKDLAVIENFDETLGDQAGSHSFPCKLSPDGSKALIHHYVYDCDLLDIIADNLILVNLEDFTSELFNPDKKHYVEIGGAGYWMDSSTLLVRVFERGWEMDRTTQVRPPARFLRYDVDDLANPSLVELPAISALYKSAYNPTYDEDSCTLLFYPAEGEGHSPDLLAYDIDGLRQATGEEEKRHEAILDSWRANRRSRAKEERMLEVEEVERRNPLARFIGRIPRYTYRTQILMEGECIRLTRRDVEVMGTGFDGEVELDPDLRLFIWIENKWTLDGEIERCETFYMDEAGQYRRWRSGTYHDKIPRGRMREEAGE